MKVQFSQDLYTSFRLWLEDYLLVNGESYSQNVPNQFKVIEANDVDSSKRVYQGKFRQLVSDTSLGNSGVYFKGNYYPTGLSGVKIDHFNGRVLVPTGLGTGAVTGLSTVREFNLYDYYDEPEKLFVHSDFYEKNSGIYLWNKDSKLDENTYFIPALFISLVQTENEPYSLGGEDNTKTYIDVVIISKNNSQMSACLSLLNDAKLRTFPLFSFSEQPYGQYWTLKNGTYNYASLKAQYPNNKQSLIAKVKTSRQKEQINRENRLNFKYPVGFARFEINTIRYPRL